MLPLKAEDRVRVLAAVARKGPRYAVRRVAVITASLAALLAVPLLGIARVDLWGGAHVVLGEPASAVRALQAIVVVLGVLYGLTFLSNMVLGRFFCGWGCPVGYVSRLGEDVDLATAPARGPPRTSRVRWALAHLAGAGFVATFVGAVMLWWVDPRVLTHGSALARAVTISIFAALWAGGFLHAFLWRFAFCLRACPIGLYYRYVNSRTPVGIVFAEDPDPCIACGACARICPVGLEPRDLGNVADPKPDAAGEPLAEERYGDAECLRCGDCVEACRMVFLIRPGQTPPLRFGFHSHETRAPGAATPVSRSHGPARVSEPDVATDRAAAPPKLDDRRAERLDPPLSGDAAPVRAPSHGPSLEAPPGSPVR